MRRLLLLVFLLASPVMAQSTQEADSLRAAGQFQLAVQSYLAALGEARASGGDESEIAYALASTYALSGQAPDSAFAYLETALRADTSPASLYDPDLYFLVSDPRWAEIESRQLDHLALEIGAGFDRAYARDLLAARMREWGYRWHIMYAFRTIGPDSPVLTALAHAMQEHHGQNERVIFDLLDAKGWPKLSAVGAAAAYAAGNLVNHGDLPTRQKYLPVIEAACRAGEADWSDYAHILDRTELELGRPQIYGTQMEKNEASGLFEPRELLDPDRVDERRAEKGLEPIAAQLARFNEAMKRDFGG